MKHDPGETVNLAGLPEYRKELERHRTWLREYIARTGDIFPSGLVGAGPGLPG